MELENVRALGERIREQVRRVVVGHEAAVNSLLVALLSEGHVLLEGMPGTAKTLLARTFARCLDLRFNRIQFTPDLMPGDVTGTNIFDFRTNQFVLTRGPLFTEVLLADEINRTPPKTQAALLEAMQERSVTIDGATHDLGPGFMVVATQNPIEFEGTYPLPEAQLDRFLFRIRVGYAGREAELAILRLHGRSTAMPRPGDFPVEVVAGLEAVVEAREAVARVTLSDEVLGYVVDIARATREDPSLQAGASTRAANMLAAGSRALAALSGRDYALPDDVKKLAPPTLCHRLVLAPGAEIEGLDAESVLQGVLARVPAPR
ncbi:MAG: MoxR family ATPase [Planctomycetes bacterium]|nr:MoxR family ATPase [Planctomycetota bacterium]